MTIISIWPIADTETSARLHFLTTVGRDLRGSGQLQTRAGAALSRVLETTWRDWGLGALLCSTGQTQ
jgi:hypothetical protein